MQKAKEPYAVRDLLLALEGTELYIISTTAVFGDVCTGPQHVYRHVSVSVEDEHGQVVASDTTKCSPVRAYRLFGMYCASCEVRTEFIYVM
jgi:hypothetical protein